MELAKLERQRAVDAVYEVLRQAIVTYTLKPGERMNIDELAQKLGVSLTPVRSAIQKLSTEGLVEIRSRSGTFVASLTAQDVEETFRIRCALECLAARDGLETLAGQVGRMKELLDAMRKPVRNARGQHAHELANSEFHQIIVRAAGNRRLVDMYEALNAHIKIARIHSSESGWPARVSREQNEHEAIVSAIEKRATDQLCAALQAHIYRAKDTLVATLRQLEDTRAAQ
jgi:GntR family transcriptional regulator, rspAB operon transcriptional repressor